MPSHSQPALVTLSQFRSSSCTFLALLSAIDLQHGAAAGEEGMSKAQLCDKLQQQAKRSALLEAEVSRLSDGLLEERRRNDYHRSLLGTPAYARWARSEVVAALHNSPGLTSIFQQPHLCRHCCLVCTGLAPQDAVWACFRMTVLV